MRARGRQPERFLLPEARTNGCSTRWSLARGTLKMTAGRSASSKMQNAVTRKARPAKKAPRKPTRKKTKRKSSKFDLSEVEGAVQSKMPASVEVQLATLTRNAPAGDEWIHEIKFDGYRMICRVDGPEVKFISRNQKDWTARLGPLVEGVAALDLRQAILDGEIVAVQPDGTSNFQSLQNAFSGSRVNDLKYYVFDLLYCRGYSLLNATLETRKQVLSQLLAAAGESRVVAYSDHALGNGPEFAREACKMHLEGIISKRRNQPYRPGRGYDWLKIKCTHTDEFVIGGYTEPTNSRAGFGALLLGYYNKAGDLIYSGKVGTGFTEKTLRSLFERLAPLERADSPFADMTRKVGPARKAHWVEPKLVAQIAYSNQTEEGFLRHPSFQGLREDKAPREVTLPQAVTVAEAVKRSRRKKGPHALPSSRRRRE